MKFLPAVLGLTSHQMVYVITPYHSNIPGTSGVRGEMATLGTVSLTYRGEPVPVEILLLDRSVRWVFLRPMITPPGEVSFFSGSKHPYDVGEYLHEAPAILRRDALLFGIAAGRALSILSGASSWVLLAQDWEAASICLAQANQMNNPQPVFITLHNSYDSPAPDDLLRAFGIDPRVCPGTTMLARALPLAEKPVFTVSEQYAIDLTKELLPARIMAPHLREILAPRLVGVNNGKFIEPTLPDEVILQAAGGNFKLLADFKTEKRNETISALRNIRPSESTPVWGDPDWLSPHGDPWFLMAGRDDPRQKGYDVFAAAIDHFLSSGGKACFLLFPIPGDEGEGGLSYLRTLAEKYPQAVLVLPFIFREGYSSAIQGASFGVMPSFYEPFGMANEFYLNGTGVIGRATGGILQQVIPYRQVRSFSEAVLVRAKRWFSEDARPTGLLYREPEDATGSLEDWEKINAADNAARKTRLDRLSARMRIPLFRSMVDQLVQCLVDAVDIYQNHPDVYYRMVMEGFYFINTNFTWEKTAKKYLEHIQS
jgi:glycosyltransferase involved in cell wall biosynthesis